jgi:competence ComEA-like helix-hairpin-helix protein
MSLIATLWIIAVLFVLASEYLFVLHLERRVSQNLVDRTQLEYVAKSAIALFIRGLAEDDTPYDGESDSWTEALDGEIEDPALENRTFSYTLAAQDENARIDINSADENTIRGLLQLTYADETTIQSLPQAIIQARQERVFQSVGDLARVEGMTEEILYGATNVETEDPDFQERSPLVDLITVYSADKNVSLNGQTRTNITSADANALRQAFRGQNNTELLTQAEAEAIVAYRQQTPFQSVAHLLDVPAVTQSVLDGARDRLSTQDEDDRVNINTADANALSQVPGFDQGTAEDVIRYRNQNGNFQNVDDIRNARVFSQDEVKQVVDNATISSNSILTGVVNLNTASAEILALLPGMDQNKAQAIVNRRGTPQTTQTTATSNQTGEAFDSIGDLLDVPGFDENAFKQVANFVTYRTQVFRINASGVAPDGKALARVTAVLDRSGDQVRYRFWQVR